MRKTLVIAWREFIAAVKSKAFVVSIVVMPLLMFGGIFVQRQTAKMGDVKTKRVAVIDRSPGGQLFDAMNAKAIARNQNDLKDEDGKQARPEILLERIEPSDFTNIDAVNQQRLELSDRIRRNELFAYVEIGPNILSPKIEATTKSIQAATRPTDGLSVIQKMDAALDALGTANTLVYATNRPTAREVRDFIQSAVMMPVYNLRMSQAKLPAAQVMPLLTPPQVLTYGLTKRAADGTIQPSTREKELVGMLIPIGLMILMFMVVMVGASPLTVNLVEEKQLRIAEVLLGSVRPFELMMGKLLGGVGVALTLGVVYFAGMYYFARQWNVTDMVSPTVMIWFAIFTVLATLMYGAMFIAAGSAVTNVKEAQSMLMPVMLVIVIPMFLLETLLRDPSGIVATVASFFPTSAPMITVARIGIPPGIPMWQTILAALITLLTTAAVVWAAGRIFRVGILMQGQGARPLEMLKWIVRG